MDGEIVWNIEDEITLVHPIVRGSGHKVREHELKHGMGGAWYPGNNVANVLKAIVLKEDKTCTSLQSSVHKVHVHCT